MPATPAQLTRKAIGASPILRALADTSIAQQIIQTQRAVRLVQPAAAFAVRQARRGTVGSYRLRCSDAPVYLRHRTRDIAVLAEIFSAGSYQPPAALSLAHPLRIADLGGNVGMFGLYALHHWDVVSIRSYEPDPANARLLKATARHHAQWHVVEAAVSTTKGDMRLLAGRFSESRAAVDGEDAISVPVVDVLCEPPADLWKIDIEGGEWPILADPRLRALEVRAVVMEWHTRGCPERDAPAYAARLLADAGFEHQHQTLDRFGSNGLLWAWR